MEKFYYEISNKEHIFYCCVNVHIEEEYVPEILGISNHGLFNPSYRARKITKEEYEKNVDMEE